MSVYVVMCGEGALSAWTSETMAKRFAVQWSRVNGSAQSWVEPLLLDPQDVKITNAWASDRNRPFDPTEDVPDGPVRIAVHIGPSTAVSTSQVVPPTAPACLGYWI